MHRRTQHALLLSLLSLALCTQLGSGCTSTPSEPPPPREDDATIDGMTIPRRARVMNEGRGELSFTAPRDGRVYLYDLDDRTLLDNQPIRRGQRFALLPDQNKATIDGKKVYDRDLKRKHNHRLYFLSSDSRWDDRDSASGDSYRLPRNAQAVERGTGPISYRAPRDGTVYVQDADDDRVLLRRGIRRGQQITVTPGKDRIEIDANAVYRGNLGKDHEHRIYFDRD